MTVDVGKDFSHELINRDETQGDGLFTGKQFRAKYLGYLDNREVWNSNPEQIILDFNSVDVLLPSFANEAFAYYTLYAKPRQILDVIKFENITNVKKQIIDIELESGYSGK